MCLKICSLIFLIGSVQIIFGQQDLLMCDYGGSYICSLTVSNTGAGFFTDIGGMHLDGKEDADVTEITATPLSGALTIPSVICVKFPNIVKTSYISIGLGHIDNSAFRNCKLIKQINLSENEITNIDELAFSKNVDLQRLYLGQNRLSSLPSKVFEKLVALRILDLSSNRLETLENEWFENLGSLQTLSLTSNAIKELPADVFAPLSSLTNLNLGQNQLEVLSSESFGDLAKLTIVDVKNNQIKAVDENLLVRTSITTLSMDGNDCANDEFIDSSPGRETMKQELGICFENFNNIVVTTTDSTTVDDSTTDSTAFDETDSTTETTTIETTDSTTEESTSDSTTGDTTTEEAAEETTPDSASGVMIGKIILFVGLTLRIMLD